MYYSASFFLAVKTITANAISDTERTNANDTLLSPVETVSDVTVCADAAGVEFAVLPDLLFEEPPVDDELLELLLDVLLELSEPVVMT